MGRFGKLLMIPLGLAAGAGGGAGVAFLMPAKIIERPPVAVGDSQFVTLGAMLVPMTLADGQFTGYFSAEPQLEVGIEDAEGVTARVPLVIHAVNVRAFRTPLASGPDGRLPDAAKLRAIVAEEAGKVLGKGVVRSVALTRMTPT